MSENIARHSVSRTRVLDWYEEFFFGLPNKDFRAGAIRQLSTKIDKIRQGMFEPMLPRDLPLFPVLVTFDSMGESVPLYMWLRERSDAQGLLTQPLVAQLTLAGVEEFETLVSLAAAGTSLVELLSRRSADWQNRRLDVQLAQRAGIPSLPGLRAIYDEVARRTTDRVAALLAESQSVG